ncbi:hypothetical protein [Patulibacter sp. SYSU D01012]|uniref:hypothetical protein n=1 Tax=Patulibacter sp. SYSU D01012 TaxID=2817381 RepID=UPI001B309DA6|nr:hypothetical protein [Patulibacter sp. SYSU D01012]
MPHTEPPPALDHPGPAARFVPAHPGNARLALELITHPSLPYAPEVDLAPRLRPLVREAALLLPPLAAAAHGFGLQQRLEEDLDLPTLDVTRARLQGHAAGIVRRLLTAAALLGPPPEPATWFDQIVVAAQRGALRARIAVRPAAERLTDDVASAVVDAMALASAGAPFQPAGDPALGCLLVAGAGDALALFVLAGGGVADHPAP